MSSDIRLIRNGITIQSFDFYQYLLNGESQNDFRILDNDIIFIATTNNLVQYDMKKNLLDVYNYSFIGQVNDMYIRDRRIWLGTTEGLISYHYK